MNGDLGFEVRIVTIVFRKMISFLMVLVFGFSAVIPPAGAQIFPVATNTVVTAGFRPPVLIGLKIHPENPLLFDFIVDQGQTQLSPEELRSETEKLVKYFFAALAIPDDEVWVNLSPVEKDRIIPDVLGQTVMGKSMLEQDLVLKKLAASLTNPDTTLGQQYWTNVRREIRQKLGDADVAADSFNKVWIVPQSAEVLESQSIVLVGEKRLKVMMADDYEAMKTFGENQPAAESFNISSAVFKDTVLPAIEREVNEGEKFASVRQMYNSAILAAWFKKTLTESLLGKIYTDKNKVAGVTTDDKEIKQKVQEQYLETLQKGIYNFIKEDIDEATGEMIPRKYFSGGIEGLVPDENILGERRIAKSQAVGMITGTFLVPTYAAETSGDGAAVVSNAQIDEAGARSTAQLSKHEQVNLEIRERLDLFAKALGIPKDENGEWKFREYAQERDGIVYFELGGASGQIRLDDGVLVIRHESFEGLDHAGRDRNAVYASSEAMVAHEMRELQLIRTFAVRQGIDITQGLGAGLRVWANDRSRTDAELIDRQNQLRQLIYDAHQQGLKAEAENEGVTYTVVEQKIEKRNVVVPGFDILIAGTGDASDRTSSVEIKITPQVRNTIQKKGMLDALNLIFDGLMRSFQSNRDGLLAFKLTFSDGKISMEKIESRNLDILSGRYYDDLTSEEAGALDVLKWLSIDRVQYRDNDTGEISIGFAYLNDKDEIDNFSNWSDSLVKTGALFVRPAEFYQPARASRDGVPERMTKAEIDARISALPYALRPGITFAQEVKGDGILEIHISLEGPAMRGRNFIQISSYEVSNVVDFTTDDDGLLYVAHIDPATNRIIYTQYRNPYPLSSRKDSVQRDESKERRDITWEVLPQEVREVFQSRLGLFATTGLEESQDTAQRLASAPIDQFNVQDDTRALAQGILERLKVNRVQIRAIDGPLVMPILERFGEYLVESLKLLKQYQPSSTEDIDRSISVLETRFRAYEQAIKAEESQLGNEDLQAQSQIQKTELLGTFDSIQKGVLEPMLVDAQAAVAQGTTPIGGIDFDPTNMNLQIKRDGKGVPLPLLQQNMEAIDIQGLFPVIINMIPLNAQNIPTLLGLAPKEPGREEEQLALI